MGLQQDWFKSAPAGSKQQAVADIYRERGFHARPTMLLAGACEELGEVAREVLLDDQEYVVSHEKLRGNLQHELIDTIVYLLAIANAYGIHLGI